MNLYQINSCENSQIRISDNEQGPKTWKHREIITKMSTILEKAIRATMKKYSNKLLYDKNFIMHIVAFAQNNGGVGNVGFDKWIEYKRDTKTENPSLPVTLLQIEYFKIAKELSYQYQVAAKEHNFFTGRTANLKSVPTGRTANLKSVPIVAARLCRTPSVYTQDIVNGAMQNIQQLR